MIGWLWRCFAFAMGLSILIIAAGNGIHPHAFTLTHVLFICAASWLIAFGIVKE